MADVDSVKQEAKAFVQYARKESQNFDANAILRGAQLTLVGALRALQNPNLFTSDIYKQAAVAIAVGVIIRILMEAPILFARVTLWLISFVADLESSEWDDKILEGLDFITNVVLQIPFFLMNLRQLIPIGPSLDEMFMMSLQWVDHTYKLKHQGEQTSALRSMYYDNLKGYSTHMPANSRPKPNMDALVHLVSRFGRRAGISLGVYLLSFLPIVGHLVLPAASFYTFRNAVGPIPAGVIFGIGTLLPKRYLATFLQSYFASRSLMRELLQPYLKRVQFTKEQQKQFFRDREGVLFGFAIGFYIFLKTPLLGVLIYGIAEASTAFLITKITDPPPPPTAREAYAQSQVRWSNKKAFLHLPLGELDASNIDAVGHDANPLSAGTAQQGKKDN